MDKFIEVPVEELKAGQMIYVPYGADGNFTYLRIREIFKDGTDYIVSVFDGFYHPDKIKLDESEIVKVLVEENKSQNNQSNKSNNQSKGSNSMATTKMNVHQKLQVVQSKLIAPKNQFNKFGKFYYRSCEDILESVKPLLSEVGATLTISDQIVPFGEKIYVESTATFTDIESMEKVENKAFAREEDKKGMDASQATGSTSSYARKYALNGLFCIDDNKDPDTDECKNQQQGKTVQQQQAPQHNQQPTYDTIPNNQFGQQYQYQQQQAPVQNQQPQPQQNTNQSNVYMVQTVKKLCAALHVQEAQVLGLIATKKLETMTVKEFNQIMACFKATQGYSDDLLK